MNKNNPNMFRFPYLSARFLDNVIPTIIKIIPPALNKPKPADTGSFPKKSMPTFDKPFKMGVIKVVRLSLSTKFLK